MKSIRLAGLAGAVAVSFFAQSAFAYQVEDFVNYYLLENGNLGNWNLTKDNSPGSAVFAYPTASGGQQVAVQGGMTPSAIASPGWTDLSIWVPARGPGAGDQVSFQWMFATENNGVNPDLGQGGAGDRVDFFYSVDGQRNYVTLANNGNAFGTTTQIIPLNATEIGWRVYSDNDRMADIFTIASFTAPVPEPGTLLISGLFLAVGGIFYHQRRKKAA